MLFHRAHELAEQVGWSEIAFQALFGLAIALRDQGDLDGAMAALDQAIEVCERAGLIAQSIQATGARAVILALAHRPQAARDAAEMASQMAERLHYPVGRAAALEARGVAEEDPAAGAELLAEAEEAWRALDRPLEATRARLLAGQLLLGHDDDARPRAARAGRRAERGAGRAAPGREGARARRRQRAAAPGLNEPGYWDRSAPAMITTVASPARPWLAGSMGWRWAIPSRLLTAFASSRWPGE